MVSDMPIPSLHLEEYRKRIKLDEKYLPELCGTSSANKRIAILDSLLDTLIKEEGLYGTNNIPEEYPQKRQLLRALLNIRPPSPIQPLFLKNINSLLQYELREKEITECNKITPVSETLQAASFKNRNILFLWKGDITSLKVDAIVNAANDQMLGCFEPLHNCIDNVIHNAAGPALREDCKLIMDISKQREPTGDAKITRAYNLPSRYVLHTVGPIIRGNEVTEFQEKQLASCYKSCLSLADQVKGIRSIAFPCISTGVFNFPGELAAEIAVHTVDDWLENNSHHFTHVIFNVFLEEDFSRYARTFR